MDEKARSTPVSVDYAAGLCGLFAGLNAFAVPALSDTDQAAYVWVNVLLAVVFAALAWGLRRGSRPARIAALVMGGLILAAGLLVAFADPVMSLFFFLPGVLLLLLLTVPVRARQYFARTGDRVSV